MTTANNTNDDANAANSHKDARRVTTDQHLIDVIVAIRQHSPGVLAMPHVQKHMQLAIQALTSASLGE